MGSLQPRRIGRTEIEVSPLCLGCWAMVDPRLWGPQEEDVSIRAIHAAFDAGIRFFDVAEGYGGGRAEELVGKALEGRRDEVVICTKVGPRHHAFDDVLESCEASLRRLRTDHVDLYLLHWPNRDVGFEEPARAIEQLVKSGKVRAFGVSNLGRLDLEEVQRHARVEVDQLPYNLLWRAIEDEIVPACHEQEVSVTAYSALAQGLLSGRFRNADDVPDGQARSAHFAGSRPLAPHEYEGAETETFATIETLRGLCREIGAPMEQVALAWLLRRPGVAAGIIGSRTPEEVVSCAAAAELELPREMTERLDRATGDLKRHFGNDPDMWRLGRMR